MNEVLKKSCESASKYGFVIVMSLLVGFGIGYVVRGKAEPKQVPMTSIKQQPKAKREESAIPQSSDSSPAELNTVELKTLYIKAKNGDAQAQLDLSTVYYEGEKVEQDLPKSAKWCKKSAEQGLARAQLAIAGYYIKGAGIKRDQDESIKWYRKAAEQGDAKAQFYLGLAYSVGEDFGASLKKDEQESFKWYLKSASQNYVDAEISVGDCYMYGNGIPKDKEMAAKYYIRAIQHGSSEAKERLERLTSEYETE